MPPDFGEMRRYLELSWDGHRNHPSSAQKSVRRHDGVTPYAVHPRLAADLFISEPKLDLGLRWLGWRALVLHDLLEDTKLVLPPWVPGEVQELVREMTFSSFEEEQERIWERSPNSQLLKLYDKVTNLLDGAWMGGREVDYRRTYEEFTLRLADEAENRWGELTICRIARGIRLAYL